MASFRQRGRMWYYRYVNEIGKKIESKGHRDYKTTQAMAQKAELTVYQIRNGLISPKDAEILSQDAVPLKDHINAWKADILAKGSTAKHTEHTTNRVRRLRDSDTQELVGRTNRPADPLSERRGDLRPSFSR
jgi:hypothetical protein